MIKKTAKRPSRNHLTDAFDSFHSALSDLGSSYRELKKQIQELNLQVAEKNRQLEENLYEVNRLRRFLDSILNSLTDGVVVVDTAGTIVLFNKGAERLTGYTGIEVLGSPYKDIFGQLTSERFSPLFTLSKGTPLSWEEKELETKMKRPIPVRYSTALVTDGQDRILGAVEVFSDLTRMRQYEKEIQRGKTQAALTEMAALVAHEVRNPLGGIRGYVDLIAQSFDQEDPRRNMIDLISRSIQRLDEIVANFQLFARPVKPHFEDRNIVEFVETVANVFKGNGDLPSKGIRIRFSSLIRDGVLMSPIDTILLEHALLAVLDNAAKAMEMGGTIQVAVREETPFGKSGKRRVAVTVSDSGEGMDPEVKDKLFTPFFTTREKGMGLGLAMAKNIVTWHQGEIFVESEKGLGTTVTLVFPVH